MTSSTTRRHQTRSLMSSIIHHNFPRNSKNALRGHEREDRKLGWGQSRFEMTHASSGTTNYFTSLMCRLSVHNRLISRVSPCSEQHGCYNIPVQIIPLPVDILPIANTIAMLDGAVPSLKRSSTSTSRTHHPLTRLSTPTSQFYRTFFQTPFLHLLSPFFSFNLSTFPHIHHTAYTIPRLHIRKRLIDTVQRLAMRDELVDFEFARHVIVDEVRKLAAAFDASECTALPYAAGDELECCFLDGISKRALCGYS